MSATGNQMTDAQIKHLEFIQGVISRMSTDSFLLKGWSLTVSTAVLGFAADHRNWSVAILGLVPVVAFWGLDAYFLRKERQFRTLYDEVREGRVQIAPFAMDVSKCEPRANQKPWTVLKSATLWPFYGLLFTVATVLTIVSGSS